MQENEGYALASARENIPYIDNSGHRFAWAPVEHG